jgi:predicted dehydrogenase
MKNHNNQPMPDRRKFLKYSGLSIATMGLMQFSCKAKDEQEKPAIQGFEETPKEKVTAKWVPVSDRKVRVGLVGYGVCKFAAQFGFQHHPNVEVVAVSDLFPDRCAELARVTGCNKTYPSLEEMVKDKSIEAIFLTTDAPSHARHCMEVLNHGKHVGSAVPAAFQSIEEGEKLLETVKRTGLKYMMFETSCFREDLYAMRQIYQAGGLGKIVYAEGEYYHYGVEQIDSYKGWRIGLPPQFYPTHSNAYYIGVTDGSFTEVSCMGLPSVLETFNKNNNRYKNSFGSEVALFRTSDGGMARMAVSWDTPGDHGERGRVRGERGTYYEKYEGLEKNLPDIERPALPPGVEPGGHGGSHGRLTDEFISSILLDRKPLIDIAKALNITVPGIVAHQSALRDGELLKIPQYTL